MFKYAYKTIKYGSTRYYSKLSRAKARFGLPDEIDIEWSGCCAVVKDAKRGGTSGA